MKILELTLTNFLPILTGIGKESVTLDLRNSDSLINVIIGKIGSGKTYILSHLQPFSTVGTLDVRNNDDPIIPEKDGKKIIVYQCGIHEYVITHEYNWTGKTHTKKSYIQKDGIELNENGNSSSFKEIIQLEFGIDQSFLRLMRIGPNVVNFINMKATERKAYIASLLSNTEIYLALHKAWSAELRTLNTRASILMNKLNSYGVSSLEEFQSDKQELEEKITDLTLKIEELSKEKYQLEAQNKSYIGNMSYREFKEYETSLSLQYQELCSTIQSQQTELESFTHYPDILEVSKTIGKLDSQMESLTTELELLNQEYEKVTTTLHTLQDKQSISENEEHMRILEETYQDLLQKDQMYKKELRGFQCEYTSTFLIGFQGDLDSINVLINELSQYDRDILQRLLHSDSSVIKYASEKIEILGYKKLKLQKEINNLKFSEEFQPTTPLYLPPFCPTKSCPYYRTHPSTLKKQNKGKNEREEKILSYQNEIKSIDIEVYKYSDYAIIYPKIQTLRLYWSKAKPVLESIGALRTKSIEDAILYSQNQVWYHHDTIIDTIDKIKKRDLYYELTEKIKQIKNELNELELIKAESPEKEIEKLKASQKELSNTIEKKEKEKRNLISQLSDYNAIYLALSEKSIKEKNLSENQSRADAMKDELSKITINRDKINDNLLLLQKYDMQLTELSNQLKSETEKHDSIKTKINDIQYTSKELDDVLQEQKYMTYMTDAVSSKSGIPLVMIQVFLDSCRDIVNDMLYAICEDDLEILPFDINETEFRIPYLVNGKKIDDISKASQGQSSIVSTIMSFAIAKRSNDGVYNIPLLDEVDGPLHKNDKQKFISILMRYLKEISSEQCFVITHDDSTFDGHPVQVIMTTDEKINEEKYTNVIRL